MGTTSRPRTSYLKWPLPKIVGNSFSSLSVGSPAYPRRAVRLSLSLCPAIAPSSGVVRNQRRNGSLRQNHARRIHRSRRAGYNIIDGTFARFPGSELDRLRRASVVDHRRPAGGGGGIVYAPAVTRSGCVLLRNGAVRQRMLRPERAAAIASAPDVPSRTFRSTRLPGRIGEGDRANQ